MSRTHELFEPGPAKGAAAKILVAHLEGALDAGSAGGLAVHQLLRNLDPERVATFESDELIDYRSHRPVMEVADWVTTGVRVPQIALDRVHDDQGQPLLVLHGQEPDSKWGRFTDAVLELANEAGVEVIFALHGLPAAVPHTRPTAVHVQSTDADLVPDQPQMGGVAQFPAPYTSFLQHRFAQQQGRTGLTLLATVPYYMANATFPGASSALIRRLADIASLSLPVGDLERGAGQEASQVDQLVEQSRDLAGTVSALERHFDSVVRGPASEDDGGELSEEIDSAHVWEQVMQSEPADSVIPEAEKLNGGAPDSLADTIGDAIEKYLKTYSKRKTAADGSVEPERSDTQFGGGQTWEIQIDRDFLDGTDEDD